VSVTADPVLHLKRRLSPLLLQIAGVSGIGAPGGEITVYLERDDESVRNAVRDVLAREAPATQATFVVTGKFRAQ